MTSATMHSPADSQRRLVLWLLVVALSDPPPVPVVRAEPLPAAEAAKREALARYALGRWRTRQDRPADAAKQLEALHDAQARDTYLEALGAAVFAGRLGGIGTLRATAEAALTAPPAPDPPA